MEITKRCRACGTELPASAFSPRRSTCKPCRAAQSKQDYRAHKAARLVTAAKYRADHAEEIAAYRAANREHTKAYLAEYTQRLRKAVRRKSDRCAYCRVPLDETWHVEHVLPTVRGGTDDLRNLVPSCPACNRSKFTKTAREFQATSGLVLDDALAKPYNEYLAEIETDDA